MDMKLTCLNENHKELKARLGPFGGWLMPIQYDGIIKEHNWTRKSASLFDICHMGEFIVHGNPVENNLDKILTVNLATMADNKCRYGFMLNEEGKIIDDLVVFKINREKWMLVVNASTIDKDYLHLQKNIAKDFKTENMSDNLGKIDLQGPLSREVLTSFIDQSLLEQMKFYTFTQVPIFGENVIVSRTGYTGELGYELFLTIENTPKLWSHILKDSRVKPAGLGARDTLRLEMGYGLYGQDIDEMVTPLESGLDMFLDFNKNFIGRDALLEQKKKGIDKKLIYFKSSSRQSPRHNYKIYSNNEEIGTVTSGSFSPSLSLGMGMGYVKKGFEKTGQEIIIRGDNREITAVVIDKPFYKEGSLKN